MELPDKGTPAGGEKDALLCCFLSIMGVARRWAALERRGEQPHALIGNGFIDWLPTHAGKKGTAGYRIQPSRC